MSEHEPLLSVRNLSVGFSTRGGLMTAVDDVSFDVLPGEVLGVVGESGSGKSVTMLSILGLLPQPPAKILGGKAFFQGRDLLRARPKELERLRGGEVAMIFQDPVSSLNPIQRVGRQIGEAITTHRTRSRSAVRKDVHELLALVGMPEPERQFTQFPHELSGGMNQRAMIAMAIANSPALLIADEPTTALDVTIQAQILDVLRAARAKTNAAVVFITHDLGLLSEIADRVLVLYAGRVMESGDAAAVLSAPRHPYTVSLLESLPDLDRRRDLLSIPGRPPSLGDVPGGCPFHPRCFLRRGRAACAEEVPALTSAGDPGHVTACHFAGELMAPRMDRAG